MSVRHSCYVAFSRKFAILITLALLAGTCAQAQTYKVLYNAPGGPSVMNPSSHVATQGHDGNMYFTSPNGGTFYGTFFQVKVAGGASVVYPVQGFPTSGGTLGTDGYFYVTNQDEGPGGNCGFSGCGQVLKISSGGKATVLYSFKGEGDGSDPQAPPIQASNGIFYGTTVANGGSDGSSTAYSITSAGAFTPLHVFVGNTEGYNIGSELVEASNGYLYGTAYYGGAHGVGTVFKMSLTGAVTVLHSFDTTDGSNPATGLFQASDGNLYGSTIGGGVYGYGNIFKITPGGTYTDLYDINPANGDGMHPGSTLTQGSDGKLYGVTSSGNSGYSGTLFSITLAGAFKTLYTFCSSGTCTDGYDPSSPLKQDTNGIFYGVTYNGGELSCGNGLGCGVAYSLDLGLPSFITLAETSGKETARIGIFGQGFSTESTVSFGGTLATKVTKSGTTFLTATVPADALTGPVTVTTGSTSLTTKATFSVTPTLTKFSPTSGPDGTPVIIQGTGLLQTTSVAFNGLSATFTVNSDTQITATVPANATTGTVALTTKGGSATSKSAFKVN